MRLTQVIRELQQLVVANEDPDVVLEVMLPGPGLAMTRTSVSETERVGHQVIVR